MHIFQTHQQQNIHLPIFWRYQPRHLHPQDELECRYSVFPNDIYTLPACCQGFYSDVGHRPLSYMTNLHGTNSGGGNAYSVFHEDAVTCGHSGVGMDSEGDTITHKEQMKTMSEYNAAQTVTVPRAYGALRHWECIKKKNFKLDVWGSRVPVRMFKPPQEKRIINQM